LLSLKLSTDLKIRSIVTVQLPRNKLSVASILGYSRFAKGQIKKKKGKQKASHSKPNRKNKTNDQKPPPTTNPQ